MALTPSAQGSQQLKSVELKPFVPARDFALSKQFYQDLGFTLASDSHGVAYFHHGHCSFLLQDFYEPTLAENLMLHWLVQDVSAWHAHLCDQDIREKYRVALSELVKQDWGMTEFTLHDPSGVLWRVAQND